MFNPHKYYSPFDGEHLSWEFVVLRDGQAGDEPLLGESLEDWKPVFDKLLARNQWRVASEYETENNYVFDICDSTGQQFMLAIANPNTVACH